MAKKRRYFPRRRNTGDDERRTADADARLQRAAQDMAASKSISELQAMLLVSQKEHEEADQFSTEQPGPRALDRYRYAARVLAEVERALALATSRSA